MSWQNPAATYIKTMGVRIDWYSDTGGESTFIDSHDIANPAIADGSLNFGDWNTVTLNPAPEGGQADWGIVWLTAMSPFGGEMFIDAFVFSLVP